VLLRILPQQIFLAPWQLIGKFASSPENEAFLPPLLREIKSLRDKPRDDEKEPAFLRLTVLFCVAAHIQFNRHPPVFLVAVALASEPSSLGDCKTRANEEIISGCLREAIKNNEGKSFTTQQREI
jgi:predicted membrane chloride channel (bestrophin family)